MSDEAERLYERARAMEPEARAAFVEEACRSEPRLREELASLLDHAGPAEEFFDLLSHSVFITPFPIHEDDVESEADRRPGMTSLGSYPEPGTGTMVGRYRILSLIGRGGMGTVYRAHDTLLERDVALKFLPPLSTRLDDEERLLMEARTAAALEHPNVCTIHEIGQTADGRPFIAMALYEGETLKERLRRGSLSLDEAVSIAVQIARGLKIAHARGILHRDVKPGNVILGTDGTVRLLDFGLATVSDAGPSRSVAPPGTVAYMSPEQARGDSLDARTDLWSLGVILYEMLTGERPFRGASDPALHHAIFSQHPEPVSKQRAEVPEALARVVERLLKKDLGDRYGSAAELIAELSSALPSGSAPLGLLNRTRRRATMLAGGTIALVALVGAAVLLPGRVEQPLPATSEGENRELLRRQSRNIPAYELYLRGNDPTLPRSESGVRQALDYFEQAIAADSSYAAAYAGLALAYIRLDSWYSPGTSTPELHALAREAAEKAVALDDSLAEAHYALGRARMAELDFAAARAEIQHAMALDPTDLRTRMGMTTLHIWSGRYQEALDEARRALEDHPLSPYASANLAQALFANRRVDEALAQLEQIEALRPPLRSAAVLIGQCHAQKRMWPEALAALRAQAQDGGPRALSLLGHTLARAGQREEARRILANLLALQQKSEVSAFEVAVVYAGLGELDQAFAWLDEAVDDQSMRELIMQPTLEDLQRDPRFARLQARLGLERL